MKFQKLGLLFLLFTLFSVQMVAQNGCTAYFPFEEGTQLGYSYFNKKGKLESKSFHLVEEISQEGDGSVKAMMKVVNQDKKGKELSEANYIVFCKNNELEMDISSILTPAMTASMESMELTVSGDSFKLPSNLKTGQELPDTHTEIQVGMNGMSLINMEINHTNRLVELKESVSTEAGTFECYKLSHDVNIKMIIQKSYHVITWYNEKVGMVKQETYNKRNKLESKTELSEYKKG